MVEDIWDGEVSNSDTGHTGEEWDESVAIGNVVMGRYCRFGGPLLLTVLTLDDTQYEAIRRYSQNLRGPEADRRRLPDPDPDPHGWFIDGEVSLIGDGGYTTGNDTCQGGKEA